ncbi:MULTISPECIES: EF-hand domain-containing protein [unclassified Bradyrhizobium]|uniref:EF-hand domain-containing protein n=1 Tax=unclassified Bradyrhizobium TaxID=2631580 RepID=UPI0028E5D663|nr:MULTISPECIES: EF-hand domain-containing protein [unclassified Bradyrhizobium]
MRRAMLRLTISALVFACGTAAALAQSQTTPDQQKTQPPAMAPGTSSPMGGMMGHMPGPMGRGGMGGGVMGPALMRMVFALVDTDGDGTISLQEFQAAHERIFKAMDSNKDGKLTPEEMQAFMHGPQ